MERLLEDAGKIAKKKFDISNFADITEAIHVMQEQMKIAGTTSEEAGKTIQGSINSMRGALQNFITGIGNEKADIDKLVDNVIKSVFGDGTDKNLGVIGNIMPVVKRIIQGISKSLPSLVKQISSKLPSFLKEVIPPLVQASVQVFVAIAQALPEIMPVLVDGLVQMVQQLVPYLPTILGAFFAAVIAAVGSLLKGIGDLFGPWLASIVQGIVNWFMGLNAKISEFFGDFADAAVKAITNFANWFWQAIENVKNWFASIPAFFNGVINKIFGFFGALGQKVGDIVGGAFKGAVNGVLSFIEGFINTPINAINGLIDVINKVPGIDLGHLATFSFPRLAKGGFASGASLATIGEAGDEAVIPLERNTENWAGPLARALAQQFESQDISAGRGITVYMTNNINNNLDADEIGRRLMTSIRRAS